MAAMNLGPLPNWSMSAADSVTVRPFDRVCAYQVTVNAGATVMLPVASRARSVPWT